MALFSDPLWLIPLSVFVGGVIGSPHCMSMCGPIVLNFADRKANLLFYQLGRMLAYSLAGALVGAFGETVLGPSRPVWLSGISLGLIGLLLLFNGYRAFMNRPLHLPMPQFFVRASTTFWKYLRVSSLPKAATAGIAGLLTVFLPCGHLYSFLLGAVATGSAVKGAVFMFAFWLGSTPLLSFGGAWIQRLLQPKIANGQRWAGVLLICAGIISVLAFGARAETFGKQLKENHANSQGDARPGHCH